MAMKPFSIHDHEDGVIVIEGEKPNSVYEIKDFLSKLQAVKNQGASSLGGVVSQYSGISLMKANQRNLANPNSKWFVDGVNARILSPSTGAWKDIKFRLKIEVEYLMEENEALGHDVSPLDDLRKDTESTTD